MAARLLQSLPWRYCSTGALYDQLGAAAQSGLLAGVSALQDRIWAPQAGAIRRSFRCTPLPMAIAEEGVMDIFDRQTKIAHRDRAARSQASDDPLLAAITERLLDRLEDCKRSFPTAVALGGAGEYVAKGLNGGRAGVKELIQMDSSSAMLKRAQQKELREREEDAAAGKPWPVVHYMEADEENLPLEPGSVDVIICSLGIHWVNNLPGALAQCRRALKPDGLVLAAMLGGETLQELRIACALAEQEREGGLSSRVSPLAQVRDAGNLLTRAGLRIPAVDVDDLVVRYPSAVQLVQHLRDMAESNAVKRRRPSLRRDTALAAAAAYQGMFGDSDGSVPATFQVIYLTGWSPHDSQQQPRQRGSARVSLADLDKALN